MNPPSDRGTSRLRRRVALTLLLGCVVAVGGFVFLRDGPAPTFPARESDATRGAQDTAPPPLAGASQAGSAAASVAPQEPPGKGEPPLPVDRLTDDAFAALETEVEGGRIEGIVMAGTRARGGGHARLWPDYMARTFGDARGKEPKATTPIAADGTFLLEGIPPGSYGLEIAPEGVATRLVLFSMPDLPGKTRRIVLGLEHGGVAGRVFDRVGKPAVGAVVHVNRVSGSRGFPMNCETRVGADGAYEIGGLPPGTYWIVTHLGADWWSARDDRTRTFHAKAGEVVQLDLGSERGEPLWTGVLRTTAGKAVRGPGELVVSALSRYYDSYDTTPFDADGGFAKRLTPGTYRVNVVLPGLGGADDLRRIRIPTNVIIADRDVAQDLVLPGTRVAGVVKHAVSGLALVGARDHSVAITPEGKDHFFRRSVALSRDGSFVFDGVVPGRYVVSGWPTALRDASRDTLTFEVRDGVPEVTLEAWAQVE